MQLPHLLLRDIRVFEPRGDLLVRQETALLPFREKLLQLVELTRTVPVSEQSLVSRRNVFHNRPSTRWHAVPGLTPQWAYEFTALSPVRDVRREGPGHIAVHDTKQR